MAPPVFIPLPLTADTRSEQRTPPYPCTLRTWHDSVLTLESGATHYGYVWQAPTQLQRATQTYALDSGMYFALPEAGQVGGAGAGIVISRWEETAFFHLGGPIEATGRLRYIDGCTDSLLIPPVVYGQACLNLLHIPAYTQQSMHTHPALRAGIIVSGQGHCVTPTQRYTLTPGCVFLIMANGAHCFHTETEALQVIAFHPESNFGPRHEDHPMLNRTYRSLTP